MDKGRIIEALAVMEKRFNGYPVAKDIIHDALHDYMDQKELTAANKAIVALCEALDGILDYYPFTEEVMVILTTHADTIKRAKEST